MYTQAYARAWRSEDDLRKFVLSFYRVGSRDQTQKGLRSRSLSHLTIPWAHSYCFLSNLYNWQTLNAWGRG